MNEDQLTVENEQEEAAPAASADDIWMERADWLVRAIDGQPSGSMSTPSLRALAQRRGWETKTLEGILSYCVTTGRLEPYTSLRGPAYRLVGRGVEKKPAPPAPKVEEKPAAVELAPVEMKPRAKRKETNDMAKDWIGTLEAAKLLGVTDGRIHQLNLEKRYETEGKARRALFRRADIVKLAAERSQGKKAAPAPKANKAAEAPYRVTVTKKRAERKRVTREEIALNSPAAESLNAGSYAELGAKLGAITDEKSKQYGDSAERAGRIMDVLYPDGIPPAAFGDALLLIRVVDKLCRLATQHTKGVDGGGEDAWRDIAGYGLIGSKKAAR